MEGASNFVKQIPESCVVLQIESTKGNVFILSNSGKVFSWGELTYALGRELILEKDSARPMIIAGLEKQMIINLACGDDHVIALTSKNTAFSWGNNEFGQLGLGHTEPVLEPALINLEGIIKVSAGNQYSFALVDKKILKALLEKKVQENYNALSFDNKRIEDARRAEKEKKKQAREIEEKKRKKEEKRKRKELNGSESDSVVEDTEDFATYVWGKNENIKLRKVSTEATKISTEPIKVLQPAWGNYNPNVVIRPNKRGKNYAYKSVIGNEIQIGDLTRENILEIKTENDHLKRKLQILTQKVAEYEREVYGGDTSVSNISAQNDHILRKITKVLVETEKIEGKKNEEILNFRKELEVKEAEINKYDEKLIVHNKLEQEESEKVAHFEDDLEAALIENDGSEASKVKITEAKNNIILHTDEYTKKLNEKLALQESILEENEAFKEISRKIKEVKEELKEADRKIEIFRKIKKVRENQIISSFFEQSQKGIDKEFENFRSLYDAISDTDIEVLSRSLQMNCVNHYIDYSDNLLGQLKGEINLLRKPIDSEIFTYKELNKIWLVLDDYIQLTREKNSLVAGLIQQTVYDVCSDSKNVDSNFEKTMQRELMKKILIKSDLSQFKNPE